MTEHIPTVEDILTQTAVGNAGFHEFGVEGGVALFTRANLRRALEAAYDPFRPDWPSTVTIDDEGAPGGPGGENFA
jgi:hypothetical protein